MEYNESKRMAFGDFVDKIFAVVLIALVGFGVKSIGEMQKDLSSLSTSVAVIMSNQTNQKESINELKISVQKNTEKINQLEKQRGNK